jgi:hypothetical protein
MKKTSILWQAGGFALVTLGGTLLHFLYEWTGGSPWVAPFSGVNESTWEHMKLLFWPLVLVAVAQYPFFRENVNYWCVKSMAILLGLLLIPVLYYTYNGAFGKSPDFINIAIFYLVAALVFGFEFWAFQTHRPRRCQTGIALAGILLLAVIFILFTFRTPRLPLFQDPVTGAYGLSS